jgi:hypothetical protein
MAQGRAPVEMTSAGISTSNDKVRAARFLLFDTLELEDNPSKGLVMGRTYYMIFHQPGWGYDRDPNKKGSALVKMPAEVPPGKMAIMDIDVTKKFDYTEYYMAAHKTYVTVHVSEDLPQKGYILLHDPGRLSSYRRLRVDGATVTVEVEKLGGELALVSKKGDYGHVICYKARVSSKTVDLPADADIVVSPEDLIEFRLRLPTERLPKQVEGIGLMYDSEDRIPLAGTEFSEVPKTVAFEFIPGTYRVACWFGARGTIVGQVTVRKSDAGKTLDVQPPEE